MVALTALASFIFAITACLRPELSLHILPVYLAYADDLYRIGGDEFVAIIHHDQELNTAILENRLLNILSKENQKHLSYELSIAYGYATFSKDIDKTCFETLLRADASMYACKKIHKNQ